MQVFWNITNRNQSLSKGGTLYLLTLMSEPIEQHRLQIAAAIQYCHDYDALTLNPVNDTPQRADKHPYIARCWYAHAIGAAQTLHFTCLPQSETT